MELPKRKRNRLNGYDYSQNGAYFITICTHNREMILCNVGANCVRPIMQPENVMQNNDKPHERTVEPKCGINLSEYGLIIENEINNIDKIYCNNVVIKKYVIMPNHIHIIILLQCNHERTQFAPTISRIIKQFKGSVTKQIGFSIWQRSFHDHVIRNEREYQKIWEYIDTNPMKWEQDCFHPSRNIETPHGRLCNPKTHRK